MFSYFCRFARFNRPELAVKSNRTEAGKTILLSNFFTNANAC